MSIQITTAKQKVEFSKMVKDYKIRYYNLGPNVLYVDYVDSGGTKTEAVPAYDSFTIASNAGNAANSYLNFYTSSGTTNIVVSKIQQDCTVDQTDLFGNPVITVDPADVESLIQKTTNMSASSRVTNFTGTVNASKFIASDSVSVGSVKLTEASLQETEDNVSNLQTDVSALKTNTQNQTATSGNTYFTGDLCISGAIATGSMPDIIGTIEQNQSAISKIQTDVATLALSRLPYGTLHFNRGKLSVANWTSVVIQLPFSLAIEYEVESWDGISYEYDNEFSFFNCTDADWDVPNYPIYGFRLTKIGASTLGFTLGGCNGEGMGASREWNGSVSLPTGRHTLAIAMPAPDESGNNPASIPVYIDGENAGSLLATVGKHNASVSFQRPLVINERGVYAGGETFNEFEIALSRISVFNFDMTAEDAPYTVADYASEKLIPPALKPSQVSLALDNYVIERNATTKLVKDASGHSYDATVTGSVVGDNDQSVKAFVDEIKTQINQANG